MTDTIRAVSYRNLCWECGRKLYPKTKREMGVVTVHKGVCDRCHATKMLIPIRDFEYATMDQPTTGDWD